MHYFLAGIVLLLLLIGLAHLIANAQPSTLSRIVKVAGGTVASVAALAAAATGRFGLAFLLGAGAMALWTGRLPFVGGFGRMGGQPTGGQTSQVRTAWISMELDHDSGEMDGEVMRGSLAGARLSDLRLADLEDLLAEAADDSQTVALLEAYVDRRFGPDWRGTAEDAGDRAGGHGGQERGDRGSGARRPPEEGMTREVALSILGLGPDASAADIKAAHKALMKKLHPDQGGSDWLAARINAAKDYLLGGKG